MIRSLAALLVVLVALPADAVPLSVKRRLYPTTGTSSTAPTSWTGNTNTYGVWYMEESSGNRANEKSGGAALTDSGTTPTTTSSVMQGSRALDMDTTTRLACTDGTSGCGGTSALDFNGAMTIGAWASTDATGNLRRIIAKGTSTTTANSTGYMLGRATGNATAVCYWQGTGVEAAANSFPASTYIHVACRRDSTNGRPYVNGWPQGTNTAVTAGANTTSDFRIGSRADATGASQSWDGRIDEVFAIGTNASDAQICRIARCGVDGTYCLCDGSSATNYKSCITNADCQISSSNGTCDLGSTSNASYGTCAGRMYGVCNGGSNVDKPCTSANESSDCPSSYCKLCAPVACNSSGP